MQWAPWSLYSQLEEKQGRQEVAQVAIARFRCCRSGWVLLLSLIKLADFAAGLYVLHSVLQRHRLN